MKTEKGPGEKGEKKCVHHHKCVSITVGKCKRWQKKKIDTKITSLSHRTTTQNFYDPKIMNWFNTLWGIMTMVNTLTCSFHCNRRRKKKGKVFYFNKHLTGAQTKKQIVVHSQLRWELAGGAGVYLIQIHTSKMCAPTAHCSEGPSWARSTA